MTVSLPEFKCTVSLPLSITILTDVPDEIRQQALNLLEDHASWGKHKITKGMDVLIALCT